MQPDVRLFPRKTDANPGRRYAYLYDGFLDGEQIVHRSHDPEPDIARALLARGITGKVTIFDGGTGKPRTIIDVVKLVNRRWIGTPYRHPKGTPLSGEFGR